MRLTRKQVSAQDLYQTIETLSNAIKTLNAAVQDLETHEADIVAKYEKITKEIKATKMWKDQEVKYKTQKFKSSSKLEAEYKPRTELHRKKIEWIVCKDIWLFIKVLAKVVKFSKVSHPGVAR